MINFLLPLKNNSRTTLWLVMKLFFKIPLHYQNYRQLGTVK
jgi:hypothetical protein